MIRARWGGLILAFLTGLALCADLIASDLPLACRLDGRTYLLPCLTRPLALKGEDNQTLTARADWILSPPIPYSPTQHHPGGLTETLAMPSGAHWLGTDDRGRDVAARLLHGTRTTLLIGPLAVGLSLLLGIACGLGCALGPRVDALLERVIELGLTFPTLFLLLTLQGLVARVSVVEIALAIALVEWPILARLVRVEALRLGRAPFVEAARSMGASPLRLLLRHVLPAAAEPALAHAAFGVGRAVLFESALTFLGFGVPPPTPSWGELLSQTQAAGGRAFLLIPPSIALGVTVLGCNLMGDALSQVGKRGQP